MALTKLCPIMSRRGYGLCMRERCAWWSEWGAEPYKDYYILQILEVQKIENWSQEASK